MVCSVLHVVPLCIQQNDQSVPTLTRNSIYASSCVSKTVPNRHQTVTQIMPHHVSQKQYQTCIKPCY